MASLEPGLPNPLATQLLQHAGLQSAPSLRLVCQSWREAVDASLVRLSPHSWPSQYTCARSCLHHVSSLDLRRLSVPDAGVSTPPHPWNDVDGGLLPVTHGADGREGGSSCMAHCSSVGSQLDLMGAAVLQPRVQAAQMESTSTSSAAAAPAAVPAAVPASTAAPLMSYVASVWPEAVPHVTPAACLRLWKCLPQLQWLQQLQLAGPMLLIHSVHTAVAGAADAAAGLGLLQQHAADSSASGSQGPTIVHTYTLEVPAALCSMSRLTSLSIDWQLHGPQDSASSSSGGSGSGAAAALFTRRRSYEGGGSSSEPAVQHVADPTIVLPREFGRLANLRSLELVGNITEPGTLLPLMGLQRLEQLVLGPGAVCMQALVPLAAAGALGALTQLSLKQRGSWDVCGVVAVLAAVTRLQLLEVQELEMPSAELSAGGQLQRALTAADVAPVGNSLTRLCWSTCGQRLASGSSLLCRSPAAAGLPGQPGDTSAAAAGPWLGGLPALQCLELSGILRDGSVLGAPALESISSSIGACSRLQRLAVKGLGLPLMPEALAKLPQLQHVSIVAHAVTRRAVLGPEAALAMLECCTALQELCLAGCELRHVPRWLAGLQHVTALQLHGNYLQDLPAGVPCMGMPPALLQLNLSDNRLRELPDSITQLSSLTRLQLDSNYLTSLPASIWELPAIRKISARENMLSSLPECSSHRAAGCSPKGGGSCSSGCAGPLGCGSGSCRRAVGAPAAVATAAAASSAPVQPVEASTRGGLPVFPGLGPLSAEEEDLLGAIGFLHTSSSRQAPCLGPLLPAAPVCAAAGAAVVAVRPARHTVQQAQPCACAGSLRSLVLAENQLAELPAGMSQLSSLRELNLSKNQLRSLPDKAELWALTGLTSLQLADNHLHKLPGGLALLQRLVELDVSGNHLPVSMPAGSRSAGAGATAVPVAAGSAAAAVQVRAGVAAVVGASSSRPGLRPAHECAAATAPAAAAGYSSARAPDGQARVTVLVQQPALAAGSSSRGAEELPQALPCPLGRLRSLQQVRLGRQQSEVSSKCPLHLLLDGLYDLAERIRCFPPIQHQCPVAKAAAAAVAHITGVTSSRRAKALWRHEEVLEKVQPEQGWLSTAPAPGAKPP